MKRLLTVAAATLAILAIAAPASAHVTVNPREATGGGYARVAFRVPNESDTESTTKLEVHLPENAPLASVSTMPVPGWTVAVSKRKLSQPVDNHGTQITEVVSVITWTAAEGAAIKPGEFQEFPVSMGRIPDNVNQLVFKALQTYSDGTVVRWIEEPKEGVELEHPAPVLKVAKAAATTAPVATEEKSTDILGWSALGLAIVGLLLAGFALTRSRRESA
ncbi:YcnI family protein [Allorhizocola rhizosphaerae]|uniref:YcnI family protein n=1 Tax=Allorhizocola rhizosphaerae TaxID=1872709 RepID=UPI000E3DA5DF|nr:YcnI family protein [Allorhizocola rhizosphaerae]